MKKYRVLFLILASICIVTAVKSHNYLDFVVDEYSRLMPFWQKMASCTPYQVLIPYIDKSSPYAKELPDIANKNKVYKVFGTNDNNSCHVKIQNYDCYFPMNIAKEYANIEFAYSKKKIENIKKNSSFSASSGEAEMQKTAQYNSTYCKLQFYVPERVKIN